MPTRLRHSVSETQARVDLTFDPCTLSSVFRCHCKAAALELIRSLLYHLRHALAEPGSGASQGLIDAQASLRPSVLPRLAFVTKGDDEQRITAASTDLSAKLSSLHSPPSAAKREMLTRIQQLVSIRNCLESAEC